MTSARGGKSRGFALLQQNKPSDDEKDASAAVPKARLSPSFLPPEATQRAPDLTPLT